MGDMRARHLAGVCAALAFGMGSQAEPEPSNDRAPAEVSVLSYNTHGLPAWIALDRPGARLPVIGRLANRYDVALLQEDFAYHDRLLLGATHPVVERLIDVAVRTRALFYFRKILPTKRRRRVFPR